ncbi:flagellar biosynthetic protein FliR [Brucepastera parasyntrophica]|uniref:flagellar biosynthetic protein FliR n=1 Tax=Brucepastera parasyntrophica TaxID=2880008 RepID=UPI00210CB283|nr:flagellar biosynthetic protein FliR [Brucepastera parasyntrophica]ULQ59803.1 flagellar biosynthetic protein FliR [Brucepastera parasyntrophica]
MTPFDDVIAKAPLFFLAAVRVFAMIMTTPLLSIQSVPRVAKIALAGFVAYMVMPDAYPGNVTDGPFTLHYVLLLVGEGLIGVITGFYVSIIFSAFSTAGQFFSYQMGFGASEVYDALAQIENPLLGQFLNLIAMLIFLQINGFQTLFLGGVLRSFQSMNCFTLIGAQDQFISFLLGSLSTLFLNAMIIALPIVGTLFLIHVSMGLLSKAAPQMNLLSEGFPITILVTFFLLAAALPYMINLFIQVMDQAFQALEGLFASVSGGIG